MSAIDTTFHWDKNPTAINGLATTYVSKRGSDTTGDGTAQNPYASKAKATSIATAGTNIMLDEWKWSEQRTLNNRAFRWWGNGKCELDGSTVPFTFYGGDYFYNFSRITNYGGFYGKFFDCTMIGNSTELTGEATHCVLYRIGEYQGHHRSMPENCICINTGGNSRLFTSQKKPVNNIFIGTAMSPHSGEWDYNNYTTGSIPTNNGGNAHSVNNASTGQTLADYFNYIHPNCLANPTTASVDEWLQCDFTAKPGSANIGRGKDGRTIGFNQGFTMYADNSADNVFKASNGATLQNIDWDSTLNGYTLVQKERVVQGATANTITLDSSAIPVDDYYNNLFVGIVGGDGYGELFLITDYDGATKTATIDGTWVTIPTANNSIYTISGTILSAVKDLGKVIKVKRNWTFADNFTALQDGQWAEFMTHATTNGKQFPTSCYSYEYSIDGVTFVQGQTADDLVSAINGENKVTDAIYGDCSPNYNEATAKNLIMRYIRVIVHIGFNIGQLGE